MRIASLAAGISRACSWASTAVLDQLAPRRCPGCDTPLSIGQRGFCDACEPLLEPLRSAQDRPPALNAALYAYGGPMAEAIKGFKYHGRVDYLGSFSVLMAQDVRPLHACIDAIVPIALHPSRLAHRGYNQSGLLAVQVARHVRVPVRARLLRRIRPTKAQVTLSAAERLRNVKDAFAASKKARGLRILLVDDVRSTGATLSEASKALKQQGASSVHTLVLARGMQSHPS